MPIEFEQLSYEVGSRRILNEIDLHIPDGGTLCLYGPTGSGKSTLGLVSGQLLPVDASADDLGWFPGQSRYLKGNRISKTFKVPSPAVYIPSNPLDNLIFPAVHDELESICTDKSEIRNALTKVGLEEHVLRQELTQLSGGMLQRLALARVILRHPKFVIADETYEWLDIDGRQIFRKVLEDVADKGGVALAMQSTAAAEIKDFTALGINAGRICNFSPAQSYWAQIRARTSVGDRVLELQNICKEFFYGRKRIPILKSASLIAKHGEWVGIFGPNGAGKSVLSRIISGLESADRGKVLIKNSEASASACRSTAGYLFQFPATQLPLRRVIDTLTQVLPRNLHRRVAEDLHDALPKTGLQSRITSLTPYEQRRVILSILTARNPSILIIDEPTWGCDSTEVVRLLQAVVANNLPVVIIISHNAHLLKSVCDRIYELREGTLHELTSSSEQAYA